ncbi:MAG: zinc-ribbon domain-containing protein [Candidatus Symbiothrix sp.]|jgi:uncharacterized membrane protein YvbJ|nr:zinc-ribbon domain-containing protein [Candidatus Symbiothrix sp.]
MALINCPECGKEISDKALQCPQCGCPINSEVVKMRKTDVNSPERMQQAPKCGDPINFDSVGRRDTNVNSQTKIVMEKQEGCFLQTLNAGCMILAVIIILVLLGGVFMCS